MPGKRRARKGPKRFRIELRPRASLDLEGIAAYVGRDSPANAERFVKRMLDSIARLERLPTAYPRARESIAFSIPIRQSVVRPYRILFMIEGDLVTVLRVYHGSRRALGPPDL